MLLRRSRLFCTTALFVCCLFTAQAVRADVIVLRSGEKYHGTIANRSQLATTPETFSQVALLAEPGDAERDLHRFHALSIDFVILENASGDTVIDFAELYAQDALPGIPAAPAHTHQRNRAHGTGLMALGIAMGLTGMFIPFGDARTQAYPDVYGVVASSGNRTYTGTNYALMIGGAFMTLAGIITVAAPSGSQPSRGWNLGLSDGAETVTMAYRIPY